MARVTDANDGRAPQKATPGRHLPPLRAGRRRDKHAHAPIGKLMLGAIGVVFGDIGTSPLYSMQTVFSIDHGDVVADRTDIFGVISLVFWSLIGIVSIKYVMFIMRADNDGEGGILALAHLTRQTLKPGGRRFRLVMTLGVLGACLFYGDSVITPAISVLSAVEGMTVKAPNLSNWVLPIGLVIIVVLFAVQRLGTNAVGRAFGPVMIVWFAILAILGLPHVISNPQILGALLPSYALAFFISHPFIAFVAMGAVVLAITGAEALYADMGHFGRSPIRRAWFGLVLPCLVINYLGQGAMLLEHPAYKDNPFFRMAPGWATIPLVALATLATVIASQAVISGAYSVSRQAERLGYFPRLTVHQTSEHEGGQIYLPMVNWVLFGGVILLMLVFRSSSRLATAYGLAVTGTFLLTTSLFLVYADSAWKWSRPKLMLTALAFGVLEVIFFAANLTKVVSGGWLPLLIATLVGTCMFTWRKGQTIVTGRRAALEGPIRPFLDELHTHPLTRVPGTAIFLHPSKETAPIALRENAAFNHVIHDNVFIVSTIAESIPHVAPADRVVFDCLGNPYDHIEHITLRFGFSDDQDIPAGLRLAREMGVDIDPDDAYYFLSRITVHRVPGKVMATWRKRLFIGMAHNAATPVQYFRLPAERTVVIGAQVGL